MKKRITSVLLILIAALLTGCMSILEGSTLSESPHLSAPYERQPEMQIEVSDYGGLKDAILNFITEHELSGEIVIYSYDGGDVQEDVDRACYEIINTDPVAAYSVSELTGLATRIVSKYEINISIEYKRTKQQVESYVNVSTLRYLRTELLSVMSDYADEAVFRATLDITADDIAALVRETYYQNPRRIVMLPVIAVETYPENGEDRIYELRFGNIERSSILSEYGASLSLYVRRNAFVADGDNDAEILLSLVENLIGACVYDEGTAKTISVHGAQNFAATAYGALVKGSAVGEGFAMAFKALCDELEFDCQVVLGYLDGMVHAWNIVALNGEYYHIDVAMCAANGIETAFLKTDADFAEHYSWDMINTVKCDGTLTYEDVVGTKSSEQTDEQTGGEQGAAAEAGGETNADTGGPADSQTSAAPGDAADTGAKTEGQQTGEAGGPSAQPDEIPAG